jgi:hypothetical protein
MMKYNCGGKLNISTVPNDASLYDVECEHGLAHRGREKSKVIPWVSEFIAENRTLGPSQIFQLLIQRCNAIGVDPGKITQKQVAYHWMKCIRSCFSRADDPFTSASRLVVELGSLSLAYAIKGELGKPNELAVTVNLGVEIASRHPPSELLIDSTRT